jgi:SAM-dependent methyltransferase
MTVSPVAVLYDALEAFEGPYRGGGSYPVHKRLRLDGGEHDDIYDWAAEQLHLRSSDRVLDAGCGVGFGTIRLAERGVTRVAGISISELECARATRAASELRLDVIEFRCASLDQLPPDAFDAIIAIESLKHSTDLDATLRTLRAALKHGGRLLIVDDVFHGDRTSRSARHITADWSLTKLYSENDYLAALGGTCQVTDLTARVRWSRKVILAAKLGVVNVALFWRQPARSLALRAFRSGLHLERLYARREMSYTAFHYVRPAGECP